jgi:hypothetical protein
MKRCVGIAVAATIMLAAPAARADEADDLVTQGDDLARRAEYAQAIEKFKAADRLRPRASNACMIGLAYLRRQLWPQAEVFLGRCQKRASASDPLPEWMDDALAQLAKGLAGAKVTELEIRVSPPGVAATVTISSFAPDESFDPQNIHLPAGPHTITVTAPGFVTATREVNASGTGIERLDIELVRTPPPVTTVVVPPPVTVTRREPAPSRSRRWGNRLLIGAGGAAVGAIVLHVLAYRTRGDLERADNGDEYRDHETTFDVERAGAISLYAVAGIAAGLGFYLRSKQPDASAQIGLTVDHAGGAMVTLGWSR